MTKMSLCSKNHLGHTQGVHSINLWAMRDTISNVYVLKFLAVHAIALLCKTANYTHTCVLWYLKVSNASK